MYMHVCACADMYVYVTIVDIVSVSLIASSSEDASIMV